MASTYFLAIQDEFTRLRGTPFLLAATDFEISAAWAEAGIPLEVVLDTMATVLEGRDTRARRVRGLKFIDRAVWKAWSDLGGGAVVAATEAEDRLPQLAARVRGSGLSGREEIAAAVEQVTGTVAERERALQRLDRELLQAARDELGENWLASQQRRADRTLSGLRSRLTPEQFEVERRGWVDEAARDLLQLPRLSLFG